MCSQANLDDLQPAWSHDICVITHRIKQRVLLQQLLPLLFPNAVVLATGNLAPLFAGSKRSAVVMQDTRYFGPDAVEPSTRYHRTQRWFAHRSASRAGRVIAVSDTMRANVLHTVPGCADRVVVARHGAPTYHRPVEPKPKPRSSYFGLTLAHGSPHKQLDTVVAAWARAGVPDLDLTMVGFIPDELAPRLRALAADANGQLDMVGSVLDPSTVAWYLDNAEFLVSASEFEAYGLAPVEAGMHGCRTVLSDIAGHREVCGDNARYFRVGDVNGLNCLLSLQRANPWTVHTTWKDTALAVLSALGSITPPR